MTNRYRNLGIIFVIMALFCALYLLGTEYISLQKSKGDVLLFHRRNMLKAKKSDDEEAQVVRGQQVTSTDEAGDLFRPSRKMSLDEKSGEATFMWENLSYEMQIKGGKTKILEGIEGWIKPGTLTALIGRPLL